MAIVSYTQSAAGEPMQFTMNKTDLLAVPKVMADPFFSIEANWFRVSFVFKHTTSGKRFVPSFRTFTGTKYLRVREGMSGGDGFELKKIIISKSDRTFLVIKTSEIPSVEAYAFSLMGSGGGEGNIATAVFWNDHVDYTSSANGGLSSSVNNSSYFVKSAGSSGITGDFELEFKFNTPLNNNTSLGISSSSENDDYLGFYGFVDWAGGYANVHVEGAGQSTNYLYIQGENTFIVRRVGTNLTMSLNGTQVFSGTHSVNPVYALARLNNASIISTLKRSV